MLRLDAGDVAPGAGYVPLSERLQQLRTAVAEL
jgi:hypothetical protein